MSNQYFNEEWKTVIIKNLDENERYAISNYGRVKSFKSSPDGMILKNSLLKGYQVISVKLKNQRKTTRYIHKLVAEHFIEKVSKYQKYVIHLDFDKENNYIENLCWVTRQTMFQHQIINPNYKRGIISNSKLTETDVMRLKTKLKRGNNKLSLIAREFGITHTQLNRIRKGENWGHVVV